MYKIYIHVAPNGKKYVGQTCQQLERRWRNGNGYVKNQYFYRAITKYGWDNFKHIVIAECETLEDANYIESKLVELLRTDNPEFGYNITGGADGKRKVSESTLQKMSEARKGKFVGEKNPNYGKTHTLETRKKISDHNKGIFKGEKSPLYGKHPSIETREKMSESRKKSEAVKAHMKKMNGAKAKRILCVETGVIYPSAREAARILNIGQGNISAVCRGIYKQAYGFRWEYV